MNRKLLFSVHTPTPEGCTHFTLLDNEIQIYSSLVTVHRTFMCVLLRRKQRIASILLLGQHTPHKCLSYLLGNTLLIGKCTCMNSKHIYTKWPNLHTDISHKEYPMLWLDLWGHMIIVIRYHKNQSKTGMANQHHVPFNFEMQNSNWPTTRSTCSHFWG